MAANTNNDEHKSIESGIDEHKSTVDIYSLETLTESLGFESLNEKSKCGLNEEILPAKQRSQSNTTTTAREETNSSSIAVTGFPPLISSLKKNGRPRFSLQKVRENGRLQISCMKNTRPDVLVERTPLAEDNEESGRVRVKFIDGDDE